MKIAHVIMKIIYFLLPCDYIIKVYNLITYTNSTMKVDEITVGAWCNYDDSPEVSSTLTITRMSGNKIKNRFKSDRQ